MDIIDDRSLDTGARIGLLAHQVGEALNATRPAHVGTLPTLPSEALPVAEWLWDGRKDTDIAICAVRVASASIKHKWTSGKLLERAQMVYDSCMMGRKIASDKAQAREKAQARAEADAKLPPKRPRASRA